MRTCHSTRIIALFISIAILQTSARAGHPADNNGSSQLVSNVNYAPRLSRPFKHRDQWVFNKIGVETLTHATAFFDNSTLPTDQLFQPFQANIELVGSIRPALELRVPEQSANNGQKLNEFELLPTKELLELAGLDESDIGLPLLPWKRPSLKYDAKTSLNLLQAVRAALLIHPDIQSARASLQKGEADVTIAESDLYPKVSIGAGLGSNQSGASGPGADNIGVSADYLVYDFGRTPGRIRVAKSNTIKARAEINASVENVAGEVTTTYARALRASLHRVAAENYVASLKRIREIISLRAESGVSDRADLTLADVQFSAAQSELISAQSEEQSAKLTLGNLIGKTVTDLQPINKLFAKAGNEDLGSDLDSNPEIVAARQNLETTQLQTKVENVSRYPTIGVQGSYQVDPMRTRHDSSSLMLTIKGDLFEGGSAKARVRAALSEESAAKSKVELLRLKNRNAYDVAKRSESSAKAQANILVAQMENAVSSRNLFFEQYTLGKRTLTELLGTETSVYTANVATINAEYDELGAKIQKNLALGKLTKFLRSSTIKP